MSSATRLQRQRREFVELALHRGWATAPKSLVVKWYEQEKFSKGVVAQLKELAENEEEFGEWAKEIRVYETPTSEILIVRESGLWG
jgi:hypothetical protein